MKKLHLVLASIVMVFAVQVVGQEAAPLGPVNTVTLPGEVKGHFDHFGVDVRGHRLFATPEDYKAVLVIDLETMAVVHTISGIGRPHAVLYRGDLNRIYVTDGAAGDLKIYDGKTYALLKSVKLLPDADSIGYDPATNLLYIDNGGGDAHQTYSMLSIVDTTAGEKVADIKIDGDTLEAMALEKSSPRIYVNNRAKNQIEVVDRQKREVVASWPVTKGKFNVAMALDEAHHRLFVACRSGHIVVFDTESGKEIDALPITKGVDDAVFDPASKRLYASCGDGGGAVHVFEQTDPDHYKSLWEVATAPAARTARLVPELRRYFVAAPPHEGTNAEVMVFEVR
jgi:DNA-binding beta-propeller fold protein YncE